MRKNTDSCLKVVSLSGHSTLVTHSQTVGELRAEIDRANERAIERGYKPQQWLIVYVEYNVSYSDDGEFLQRNTEENVILKYPESVAIYEH